MVASWLFKWSEGIKTANNLRQKLSDEPYYCKSFKLNVFKRKTTTNKLYSIYNF